MLSCVFHPPAEESILGGKERPNGKYTYENLEAVSVFRSLTDASFIKKGWITLAQIIDGRAIAKELRAEIKSQVKEMAVQPNLQVIIVGEDPASMAYARSKGNACKNAGIAFTLHELPSSTGMDELRQLIERLNADDSVHGIMLELPLPKSLQTDEVVTWIKPEKDVDGITPTSAGHLYNGKDWLYPATPQSVMEILKRIDYPMRGAEAILVGYGATVGRPLASMIMQKSPTLTICRSAVKDLGAHVRQADLVIAATGRADLIRGDMLKPGCTVIDVGINELPDGSLVGDVNYEEAEKVAGAITPVPGGVGALTTAIIMQNLLKAMKIQGILA